jgi:hypothetical protein
MHQTRTERLKIREQNAAIETLKRRIASLEEENRILKQTEIERTNTPHTSILPCNIHEDSRFINVRQAARLVNIRKASRLVNIKRARSGYLIRNFHVLPESERVKGVKIEE